MSTKALLGVVAFVTSTGLTSVSSSEIVLEDFTNPSHDWGENNDPVMGGESTGTTTLTGKSLIFNGTVVDVPFLKAPGFITTVSTDNNKWTDVSSCTNLAMTMRSSVNYTGYRVSFGHAKAYSCKKFFAYGFKAPFQIAQSNDFQTIEIPFADFSDCWDDSTGDIITQCSENKMFCPTERTLEDIETISVWGEGKGGDVHLEISKIAGSNCSK